MAEEEFELVGNDRYFKYRYVKESLINYATIEETWGMPNQVSRYEMSADYAKRTYNIKAIFEGHKVPYFEMIKLYDDPLLLKEAHSLMFPLPLSYLEGRQEYFSPTPPFSTSKMIIVSAAPKRVLSTSLSFINMDTPVIVLTVLIVIVLSLLLVFHSVVMNKYKSLPTKKVVKKMAHETLENVWEHASLLCAEPIGTVLPHITCRLLAASWLIGVTFLLFFLGCFLRTEFTTESYNYIDTLSDLIKSGVPPVMIEGSGTLEYLQVLASEDPVVQKWLDGLDREAIFASLMDYLSSDGYIPILTGEKALIITDTHLTWLMGEALTADQETKEFFVDKGGLYLSQQEIGFDYMHIFQNASWIRSSFQCHENGQLSMGPIYETEVFKYLDFVFHYPIEYVTWRKPLKSVVDLELSSVIAPFYWFFTLMSASVAVLLTEIIFNKVA